MMSADTGIGSRQQKMHYKETDPMKTVEHVRNILSEMGIETEESWLPVSSIGTYSLRLTVKGTNMGTNGKGVSREFAMASAYAEFAERYQNGMIDMGNVLCDESAGVRHFVDEKIMSALQIAELDNTVMNSFFKRRGLETASLIEKAGAYAALDQTEYYVHGVKDKKEVRPYYNATKKCIDYLPYTVLLYQYGSNGMCAGNSPEEALIQGISEILERYVQTQMMLKSLSFPDVPEEEIAKYPYVYEMYKKAAGMPGYRVSLKDCSMGGKLPVAAMFVTKKNSGRFGLKFGAHPDFGVAMERSLTESSQGLSLQDFAKGSILHFNNPNVDMAMNIYNSFKFGHANYPYQITGDGEDFSYTPVRDVSGMENSEILSHMVGLIEGLGFEICIRDATYLGFPSYHIVIPGMSELIFPDDTMLRAFNTRVYLGKYINLPHLIDEKIAKYIIGSLEYWSCSLIDNKMRSHTIYDFNHKYPGEEIELGWLYMSSMCYAFLGDWNSAAYKMWRFLDMASLYMLKGDRGLTDKKLEEYGAIYNYLNGRGSIGSHQDVMKYIRGMYDDRLSDYLDEAFCRREEILVKQFPAHDYTDKGQCLKSNCCDYHMLLEVSEKLKFKQKSNPINQGDLAGLFKN